MKYIIEFEDEPCEHEGGKFFYTCKQIPYWSVDKSIINGLTPYTEPDRKVIENEVWEFVQKFTHEPKAELKAHERMEIWGTASCDKIINDFTYSEAKAKYEEWLKQKNEIHVGDECVDEDGYKCVVAFSGYSDIYDVIYDDGSTDEVYKGLLRKTGRHYDYIEKLLEKMQED